MTKKKIHHIPSYEELTKGKPEQELVDALGRIANKTMSHYASVDAMATDFKIIAINALAKYKGKD